MNLRSKSIIILIIATMISLPICEVKADSSAAGIVLLEPGEWWYYPMVAGSGELLECSFHTNGRVVESFIVYEDYYFENMDLNEAILLYHRSTTGDEFDILLPSSGGWLWVFINHGTNVTEFNFQWLADSPRDSSLLFNYTSATVVLGTILAFAGYLHIRRRREDPL